MRRVLFATDSYGWKATANGICVAEIAGFYQKQGFEVHVLCFRRKGELQDEVIEGIHIHRIKMNPINSLRAVHEVYECSEQRKHVALFAYKWLNRLQSIIFLYWYPMRTPLFIWKYYRRMERLYRKYGFEMVVSSYAPFEAMGAAHLLKKKYSEVFVVIYILDSLSNLIPKFFLSKEWQDKKGWRWEQRFYHKYDLILNLRCHDKHYTQKRYDVFRDKMKSTDIPHMIDGLMTERRIGRPANSVLNITYAGVLQKITGSYAMKLLSTLEKQLDFEINIYTRSNKAMLEGEISSELSGRIKWHGFVPREEVLKRENEADILICMGNPYSDFITSKIFEMMMTGNKILHFYNKKNDPAIMYLKRYPNSCLIDVNNSLESNRNQLIEFIESELIPVSMQEIINEFSENTPENTFRVIESKRNEEISDDDKK